MINNHDEVSVNENGDSADINTLLVCNENMTVAEAELNIEPVEELVNEGMIVAEAELNIEPVKELSNEDVTVKEAELNSYIEPVKKLAKKKVALIFGYIGTGFSGLQLNEGVRTVEEVLEKAYVVCSITTVC
jgi:hypothetical protein